MIVAPRTDVVENWRRLAILGVVLAVLVLAVVANSTMKRHRAAAGLAPAAAVTFVHPTASAQSTAWYCPGPLPLGLKKDVSSLVIANASTASIGGQLLVSTSTGLSLPQAISIPARSTSVFPLPATPRSSFGAASVLVNGGGIGVEEVVDGPTGREAAACIGRASTVQYLPGGSTRGASDIALAIYDPGATPSVANVSFATSSGPVSPVAYQGLPIESGHIVVLDVGQVVAQREVVATIVSSTGGHIVVGAIERAAIGKVVFPSLVSASSTAESNWYLPAVPAGGSTLSFIYSLNPGSSTTAATVETEGSAGDTSAVLEVPAGGVARLTENPASSPSALRSAEVTTSSSSPIVILGSSLLERALVAEKVVTPKRAKAPGKSAPVPHASSASGAIGRSFSQRPTPAGTTGAAALPAGVIGLPNTLPIGYALNAATVASEGWLLPGGANDGTHGEYVTVTNPGDKPATVALETLANGEASVIPNLGSITLAPGQSIAIDLARVIAPSPTVTVLASASAPIVVAAGLYAKGSSGSVGLSDSVAIPLD